MIINKDEVPKSICQAFEDLSEECFGYLQECINQKDLVKMKQLQFKRMIEFLLSKLNDKTVQPKLLECPSVMTMLIIDQNETVENKSNESVTETLRNYQNVEFQTMISPIFSVIIVIIVFTLAIFVRFA